MNPNDPDRDVMNQSADFIIGTSLSGWITGLALGIYIMLLASVPAVAIRVFAGGILVSATVLNIWLVRRLKNDR